MLDALEQGLWVRRVDRQVGLVRHSDRNGVQCLSICYTEPLSETVKGLHRAKVVPRCGPWRGFKAGQLGKPERLD